jgi:hypothetical protein
MCLTVLSHVHKDTKPLDPTRARKPPRPQSRGDAYGQAAKIVAAVRDKSAGDKAGNVLFDPDQLNEALVSIGAPTSRVRRSHDEVITEIDNNLLLAKERLAKVEALKANAHLIRGAVRITMKPLGQNGSPSPASDDDFEIAINHPSTRVHGLELRGLLRSRQGAFQAASEDFTAMAAAAGEKGCTQARSQRYQAETLMRQAKGTIVTRYREAHRCLNAGFKAIDFDRDRTADERLESARNRATYAEVQDILGADAAIVRKAIVDASAFNRDADGKPLDVNLQAAIDAKLEALDAPQP